jgi:hypothetical protein
MERNSSIVRVEWPRVSTVNLAVAFTLAARDVAESSLAEGTRLLAAVADFVFLAAVTPTPNPTRARYLTQLARAPKINRLKRAGVAHW